MTNWIGSTSSVIVHTIIFVAIFGLLFFGVALGTILLILTTAVSLEAIYLAIFIQMTVNRNTESLEAVEEDLDVIQEDVEGIEKDIDEMQEDVEELEKEVDELSEDISDEEIQDQATQDSLVSIEKNLAKIMAEIETLKQNRRE